MGGGSNPASFFLGVTFNKNPAKGAVTGHIINEEK